MFAILSFFSEMNAQLKILSFAGSTRENSLNKKLAREVAFIATKMGAQATYVDLRDLPVPIYDGDFEEQKGLPENVKRFRQLIQEHDVIIIASPNYNGSYPGLLKNLLDWVSRSESTTFDKAIFSGKKFGLISATPGRKSNSKSLEPLRDLLVTLRATVIPNLLTIEEAGKNFDESGRLKNTLWLFELEEFIGDAIQSNRQYKL